jgi:hypothetical protein
MRGLQIHKILALCSKLKELPRDMKELVNLMHLEIDGCERLTYMPRGLGLLTNLQTLSNFVVHKDPLSQHSSGLKELEGLNNLRGYLSIENLRHGKDGAAECKEANLKEKQHLYVCFYCGVLKEVSMLQALMLMMRRYWKSSNRIHI